MFKKKKAPKPAFGRQVPRRGTFDFMIFKSFYLLGEVIRILLKEFRIFHFMGVSILAVIYIIAAVTFIMGLKMMSNPATARKGNIVAGVGMVAAIFGTIFFIPESMMEVYCKIISGFSVLLHWEP